MLAMTQQSELNDADIARALRGCREYKGLSQKDMGLKLGMSGQAYSRFESGRRLKPADLSEALAALGITLAQLPDYLPAHNPLAIDLRPQMRTTQPLPVTVYATPRFAGGANILHRADDANVIDASTLFPGSLRALQAPDNLMSPAVEQGQQVFFDLNTIPRRNDLCVIELTDKTLILRNYLKQDGSHIFLETLFPERRETPVPLKNIAGTYAVTLRGT